MKYLLPSQKLERLQSLKLLESSQYWSHLGRLLVFLFLITLLSLFFLPWQQTSVGHGRVAALSPTDRVQNIDAPIDGRLGKWHVTEGSSVKEGDPIVEIQDNDTDIMSRLRAERNVLASRLTASQIAAKTAKLNVERQRLLLEKGLTSQRSYEQAQLEFARYLTDEANSSAELSRIEVRLARQNVQVVNAPRTGTILRRKSGQQSEMVKAGDVLAVIVPETDSRAVELFIDGNDIPLIREGQDVRLQFEGWPAIQFSGWPSVAVGTFGGKVAYIDAADSGHGQFRVLVSPSPNEAWPSGKFLRQGIRANGWILLSQVSLGFELWRQFNGFPPSLPQNENASSLFSDPAPPGGKK